MTILLPTLAVAFAAFCVWLTVRIVNRRERWATWTAVLLAVVAGYPMSLLAVDWIHPYLPNAAQDAMRWLYAPLHWLAATLFGIGNG
jgi:hypothetical protein